MNFRDGAESGKTGKLGRGLSKIKRDVLGKTMEGSIDTNNTDQAFDIADMYVSTLCSIPVSMEFIKNIMSMNAELQYNYVSF